MKKSIYIILMISFISCSSKKDVEITEIPNNYDIVVFPHNQDTLIVDIPITFIIKNQSLSSINLTNFSANLPDYINWIILYDKKGELMSSYEKAENIGGYSSKEVLYFIPKLIPKRLIDSSYWCENCLKKNFIGNKLILAQDLKKFKETKEFETIKKMFVNDSVNFLFRDNNDEFIFSKTGRLSENKFYTTTLEDIKKMNKNQLTNTSVFNPNQYKKP